MVTILISSAFRGAMFSRGVTLISMWIPKGVALIKERRLFGARCLLGKYGSLSLQAKTLKMFSVKSFLPLERYF